MCTNEVVAQGCSQFSLKIPKMFSNFASKEGCDKKITTGRSLQEGHCGKVPKARSPQEGHDRKKVTAGRLLQEGWCRKGVRWEGSGTR